MCEELCKVLLHCAANDESKQVTKVALVTLLCNCPVKVSCNGSCDRPVTIVTLRL